MKYILETDRLSLREFRLGDAKFIIELINSPDWLKFIGDRNVKTEEQAISYIQDRLLKSYQENGFGFYLVEKKDDNSSIGLCGISKRDHLDFPDIGFAFLPGFTGQGYAYEMAKSTLAYAKISLNIVKIAAITVADNERSKRLLEKIGLRYVKNIREHNEELLVYSN